MVVVMVGVEWWERESAGKGEYGGRGWMDGYDVEEVQSRC